MAILSADEMRYVTFQPVLQNRFVLYMDGFAAFMVRGIDGVGWEDSEVMVRYINGYFKLNGFRTYNDITLQLYDPITPSATAAMVEWSRLQHELSTQRNGYADFYWRDLTLNLIGPAGDVVREWIIYKAFPKSMKFGTFTYDNAEQTQLEMVLGNSGIELNFG